MKDNKDLTKFRTRYFRNYDEIIKHFKDGAKDLIEILFKAQTGDRPDGYFYDGINSTLYIFEHFEFDCSPNKKSGSKLRENTSFVKKEISKEISNSSSTTYDSTKIIEQGYRTKHGSSITYYIGQDGDKYRDNYISNFKKVFENHKNKIENYIINCKNIIKEIPTKIITTFLIEDITMFGTHYKNGSVRADVVNLLATQQFFNIFKDSKVDVVIFGELDSHFVDICDKDILSSDDSKNLIDLMTQEFYIIPAAPLISSARKS